MVVKVNLPGVFGKVFVMCFFDSDQTCMVDEGILPDGGKGVCGCVCLHAWVVGFENTTTMWCGCV